MDHLTVDLGGYLTRLSRDQIKSPLVMMQQPCLGQRGQKKKEDQTEIEFGHGESNPVQLRS
jgi:hypothetical protein